MCQEDGVKECIHDQEAVCVSTANDLREGFWQTCPLELFCCFLNVLFLMESQGCPLNTTDPASVPLSLYFT